MKSAEEHIATPHPEDIKKAKIITENMYEIEVYECPTCNFHLGLDGSYLEQVGPLIVPCPACKTPIMSSP